MKMSYLTLLGVFNELLFSLDGELYDAPKWWNAW
jgi:hypothetical protein